MSDSLNNNSRDLVKKQDHSENSDTFSKNFTMQNNNQDIVENEEMLMHFSDDDDCESNTSSLESASEDEQADLPQDGKGRREGGGSCKEEELGSSASCSVDSFELRSPTSTVRGDDVTPHSSTNHTMSLAQELEQICDANISTTQGETTTSPPVSPADSGVGASASSTNGHDSSSSTSVKESDKDKKYTGTCRTRESIKEELSRLDTGLPQLDFDKLEQQLNNAAKEREMRQRKLMSEEVRRKLATEEDSIQWHPPAPTYRPMKSNLATRLQSGMNLQICYMNDAAASDDDARLSSASDSDEEFLSMPKSKSMPISLSSRVERALHSNGQMKASELRKRAAEIEAKELNDSEKRSIRLAEEAQVMMGKAKQAAHMQVEVEKQERHLEHSAILQSISGISLARKKLTRLQLKKFSTPQLLLIVQELNKRIEKLNEELVYFLIDRDSLHMEQDSMLVDVEDLLQHQRAADLNLPDFLVAAPMDSNKPHSNFRIFKR